MKQNMIRKSIHSFTTLLISVCLGISVAVAGGGGGAPKTPCDPQIWGCDEIQSLDRSAARNRTKPKPYLQT